MAFPISLLPPKMTAALRRPYCTGPPNHKSQKTPCISCSRAMAAAQPGCLQLHRLSAMQPAVVHPILSNVLRNTLATRSTHPTPGLAPTSPSWRSTQRNGQRFNHSPLPLLIFHSEDPCCPEFPSPDTARHSAVAHVMQSGLR